jgi:hypothetical protein
LLQSLVRADFANRDGDGANFYNFTVVFVDCFASIKLHFSCSTGSGWPVEPVMVGEELGESRFLSAGRVNRFESAYPSQSELR